METTLLILKPDAVQRGLIGRVIARFEDKGLTIAGMKLMRIPRELAERHYAPHKGKPFYAGLLDYITAGPVVILAVRGQRAIDISRRLMGKTFGFEAEPGTIRGDFGASKTYNLIHGSDSPQTAEFEIGLYFEPQELINYARPAHAWTFKENEA
jgi:nucleoside-diphosphate kinase